MDVWIERWIDFQKLTLTGVDLVEGSIDAPATDWEL